MIIAFRNFFRNKMVNLSATSIRHFIPNAKIYCFSLYKNNPNEYDSQEPLHPYITEFKFKTKYVGSNKIQDHEDTTKTNGYANPDNAKYFSEGFNLIHDKLKNYDEKVLILAEDHFFTTGKVLKELVGNPWHVAYANGYAGNHQANGSILGINPAKVKHIFPLKENYNGTVENSIGEQLLKKIKKVDNLYRIKNRNWIDYCGDGIYTNSSKDMEEELKKANII
jgi:hypothetical protein